MFKTILVAYDGSDHAEHALKTAAELAKTFSGKIHLAHCPQVDTPPIVIGSFVSVTPYPSWTSPRKLRPTFMEFDRNFWNHPNPSTIPMSKPRQMT